MQARIPAINASGSSERIRRRQLPLKMPRVIAPRSATRRSLEAHPALCMEIDFGLRTWGDEGHVCEDQVSQIESWLDMLRDDQWVIFPAVGYMQVHCVPSWRERRQIAGGLRAAGFFPPPVSWMGYRFWSCQQRRMPSRHALKDCDSRPIAESTTAIGVP